MQHSSPSKRSGCNGCTCERRHRLGGVVHEYVLAASSTFRTPQGPDQPCRVELVAERLAWFTSP